MFPFSKYLLCLFLILFVSAPLSQFLTIALLPAQVLLLLAAASVRADAEPEADARPDPFFYVSSAWAADQFGPPTDTRGNENTAGASSFGFLPALAPRPAFLAIGDVRAAPSSVVALRKPAQVLRQPLLFFTPPFFFHAIHIRVPDPTRGDARPVPVAAPFVTFATQHTVQEAARPEDPSPAVHAAAPTAAVAPGPSFASQHTAQVSTAASGEEDDEPTPPNYVLLAHFPTQLPSIMSFRGVGDEPVAPAGIAQSLQPTFFPTSFRNDFAHPTLHDKTPSTDGTVIEA